MHGHKPAKHHQVWIDRITEVVEGRGEKCKLLIIAPPGHAKSTWISLIFPPWYLGNHPDHSILFFTSSDAMARQFGGTVKQTLEGNEKHSLTFSRQECQPDLVRGWSNDGLYLQGVPDGSKDPSYRAMGYGASVVGARAHGIILDDPLTQEEAQSETVQETARRYHDMTIDSRLHPDGWEIAIMTRWHENDLAAHLMAKGDWDVLHMPAIGYWGEDTALWPERFSLEAMKAKQKGIGGPMFACLYQGDPTALGGTVFKSGAWFRPLPSDFYEQREDGKSLRDRLNIIQFWDLAYSEKTTADYTAAVTLGVDSQYNIYILNVLRKRVDESALDDVMVDHIVVTVPRVLGIEEAAYKQASVRDLIRRLARKLQGKHACAVIPVAPSRDKVTRALLPAARAEAGQIYADREAPWWPTFLNECIAFPLGTHDDQVDALSGACQLAIEKAPPQNAPSRSPYGWSGAKKKEQDKWPW